KSMSKFINVLGLSVAALLQISSLSALAQENGHIQLSSKNESLIEIINGKPVNLQHPLAASVAGIFVKVDQGDGPVWFSSCTATVLTKKYILTAAHCLQGTDAKDMVINFSINSVDNDKQQDPATRVDDIAKRFNVRQVKDYRIHPGYQGSGSHDLAVISIEGSMPKTAKPVTLLPDSLIDLPNNKTTLDGQKVQVTLMGFGLISESPPTDTEVLRITSVPARFEDLFVVTDQTGGSGGCNGDSGGPAFMSYKGKTYQVGVTHGPHGGSMTCHEEGEWMNPALDKAFLNQAMKELK
ncbi:MAG: trypsin-like serine protease, partial [Bdellovibrionaceae bacterium]|nr:trypsin-like serine protease [Pseudobdellovibrionaceae bacterium]